MAVISIELILPEVGAKQILATIVVVISHAHGGSPADVMQSGFLGYISESAVAIVLIQPVGRACGRFLHSSATQNEDVHPTVVVIVQKGAATAGGFEDVILVVRRSINHRGH